MKAMLRLVCFLLLAASVQAAEPKGWFVFQPLIGGPRATLKPSWPGPKTQGVVIRITANQLETSTGSYDWTALDARVAELHRRNPAFTWQLQIYTGVYYPPRWELLGAKTVRFRDAARVSWKMLLPWDLVAQIQYRALMQAAGARYGNDPTLTMVHVTFPQAYSPEMQMPPEVIRLPGYALQISAAYDESINTVAQAFPTQAICLNLFNLTMGVNRTGPALAQAIALKAVTVHGAERMHFQLNGWNAKANFGDYAIYQLLVRLAGLGYKTGLEQVDPSANPRYGGTFEQSLPRLVECQAHYAIIYNSDQPKIQGWWSEAIPDNP